ncbi:MAG: response regulator [Desulfobacterales bacterium]|nr:response regulator [Desulfobacterales bacterium]
MKISIRNKLVLTFILVIILPMTVTTFVSMKITSNRFEKELRENGVNALKESQVILTDYLNQGKTIGQFIANNNDIINGLKDRNIQQSLDMNKDFWRLAIVEIFSPEKKLIARSFTKRERMENFFTSPESKLITQTLDLNMISDFFTLPSGLAIISTAPIIDRGTLETKAAVIVTYPLNVSLMQEIKVQVKADITIQWNDSGDIISTLQDKNGQSLTRIWNSAVSHRNEIFYAPIYQLEKINGNLYAVTYSLIKNNIGKFIGILSSSVKFHRLEQNKRDTFYVIYISSGIAFLFALLLGFLMARSFTKPVYKLVTATRYIANGRLDESIDTRRKDELGSLAESIAHMRDSIRQQIQDLQMLNQTIEKQNAELKKNDKLKDEFLANTSHELRTPLNGIIGIAESMLDEVVGPLTNEQSYNLSLIVSSGYRLTNLVNDILDFSKLRQKDIQMNIKPLDIRSIIDVVLMLSKSLIKKKNIQLINKLEKNMPAVKADESRLQQILLNLIGNAIKFTDHGTIDISAQVKDSNMVITIADTGIGIPKEKFDSIFGLFEQADGSIARKYGGTGIGLTITKNLVELQGGQIWVESEIGIGSKFNFSLPISKRKAEPLQAIDKLNRTSQIAEILGKQTDNIPKDENVCHHILVVDDEPVNIQVLKNQFSLKNYWVTAAANGIEALSAIEKNPRFDAVLLDVMMPGMSGYEVCERIRQNYKANELPILMLTAKNLVEDLVAGFRAGANDYLSKPFVREELLSRINVHLQLKDMALALLESEKKYRDIFNNAVEGIFQITPEGRFLNVNPAMAKILGYDTVDELIGTVNNIKAQVFADSNQFDDLLLRLEKKESISQYETRFYRKNRTLIWGSLNVRGKLNDNGKINRIEGLLEDISDQKSAEEAMIKAYREIEKRVQERTDDLQKANEHLKKAKEESIATAQAKSEFLANMSHEIRTPMNGVIAAADLAMGLNPDPKMERYLNIIQSSGNSLLGIINDILDFSKIEAGKLVFEMAPFVLNEIFENLATMFGAKIVELNKNVELIIDIQPGMPQTFIGDRTRLQQVLTNFLGNAVKFTEKGYIIVGVKDFEKASNESQVESRVKLQFYVKDTGIGMKKSYLKNLFEPFTQADESTTRKYGGTGLGMTISKKLVEMMGGEIWAESELGKGSTFYFTVDMAFRPDEVLRYQILDKLKNLNVLVIDDCEETCYIIAKYLNALSFNTYIAFSGNEGILKLKENQSAMHPIDLVITDWLMPGIDGIETTRYIRKELNSTIPIIMMSAFGKADVETEAIQAGVNLYIAKPANMQTLYNSIMHVFGLDDHLIDKPKTRKTVEIDRNILSNRSILLAEDNLTNQEIATAVLSKADIIVKVVNNGKEAVDALYKNDYDAILMDVQMPEMNGYEAARLIRKDIRFENLPIIAMTAHAMKGDKEKCIDAGMNGYVTKPINQQKLFETLGKFLKDKPPVKFISEKEISIYTSSETKNLKKEIKDYISIIDVNGAMDALGLDEDTFKKILMGFYRNNQSAILKIQQAFQKQDWKELMEFCHSLKGSSANIGAMMLQEASKVVEFACKDSSKKKPDKNMINALEKELTTVLSALKTLSEPDTKVEVDHEIDMKKIKEISIALIQSLKHYDPPKVKKHYAEFMTIMGAQKTLSLKEYIDNYDYDMALSEIKTIIE